MSKPADLQRLQAIREGMEAEALDAFVLRLPENLTVLSGYYPLVGISYLVFPIDNDPVLIVPDSEEEYAAEQTWVDEVIVYNVSSLEHSDPIESITRILTDLADGIGNHWRRVGAEISYEIVAPAARTGELCVPATPTLSLLQQTMSRCNFVDVYDFLTIERGIKTEQEIAKLRQASQVAGIGIEAFRKAAIPGHTEAEVVAAVEGAITMRGPQCQGVQVVHGFAQISSGVQGTSQGWKFYVHAGTRVIEPGDLVLLELGVVVDGWWSDITRVVVAGNHTDKQQALHEIVLNAQTAARNTVKAGVTANEIDDAARQVIAEAGYRRCFFHITGHGIGARYHEPIPLIAPNHDQEIRPGMVFSIEPGIYSPEFGGIRIEDIVVATEKGHECLTEFERGL